MKRKYSKILRFLPLAVVILLVIFYVTRVKNLGVEDILNLAPENYLGAAGVLFLLFAVKSLTIVFPIAVLQISAGMIFPTSIAIAVNITGDFICATLPYFIGRISGGDVAAEFIEKHTKKGTLIRFYKGHEFFFCYILRVISCLPLDIVSMMIGSMRIPYAKYISGTILGLLPGTLAITILGEYVSSPFSPQFIGAVLANVAIVLASFYIYRKVLKNDHHFYFEK